ncbi:hypothetical protein F1C58_00170 [Glaciihabitans sp. INWT7]|uniref:hypothetical protein n=1 Tax=Glaciihabitans sp. INWT7 TaxID=2596912 RepID=UPI001623DDC2|nr:hypothetical protein [Glaciihabitans sp. INWT7]QNE45499.1 hypothetical protein F1C58_00170 [Glaciihabitans sp. INWT7]
MRGARESDAENEASRAALLAAVDNARLRRRMVARLTLLTGVLLIAGSVLLWPRGLFGLGNAEPGISLALITGGSALLLLGIGVIAWSVRRLSLLHNNYSSTGKPDSGFVFRPDIGLPQIGQGHGGPLDASAALFANPDKVNNGRR